MAVRKGKPIRDVIRGDTRRVSCTFYDEDGTTLLNLAGGTVYFTVNASGDPSDDTGVSIQKSATSFTDAANGNHIFTLTHSDTNIDAGDYWYDSQFKDSVGNYLSAYRGTFQIQSDITRT